MGSVSEFLVQQFFMTSYSKVTNKMWSKSLTYALSIANLDGNKKEQEQLKYVYENTTNWIGVPLPIIEDFYENSRLRKVSKMKPYTIGVKEFYLHEIITGLSDAFIEMNRIVTQICKRANIDLVFDLGKYGNVIQ